MPTDSITKDFVVKDYDAYLRLLKDINSKNEKCKDCNYLDICSIIEASSDEVCESIQSCTKEFLYEKITKSLDGYLTEKEN